MNQEYWDRFARTGRVEDYLSYREKEVCKAKTEKYGDKCSDQLTAMTGMILSAHRSVNSKRVVILTKEKGKISAFAKGARRPNSPLAGACTPCNFGKFMLYEEEIPHSPVGRDRELFCRAPHGCGSGILCILFS